MAPIVPPPPPRHPAHRRLTRVVVTGSESTGKSQLAGELAGWLGAPLVLEFAREYAATHPTPLTAADVDPIGRGQVAREDAALRGATGWVIHDTDLLSTLVYAEQYYGVVPGWIPAAVEARLADLYLLCDIDVAWVADAIRDAQHLRDQMHHAFLDRLDRLGATYRVVRGTAAARFAEAARALDAWARAAS
jgi:NadR type nicotinamide-nucleotide adenylyltransferase